jgi:hypothetical protein
MNLDCIDNRFAHLVDVHANGYRSDVTLPSRELATVATSVTGSASRRPLRVLRVLRGKNKDRSSQPPHEIIPRQVK